MDIAHIFYFTASLSGIRLKPVGNAAYVACLQFSAQGSKWLSDKSVWLVFRRSWFWIPAGSWNSSCMWTYFSLSFTVEFSAFAHLYIHGCIDIYTVQQHALIYWPQATDDKEIVYVSDYFCLKRLLFVDVYQRSKTKSVDPGAGTPWCLKYCPNIQWW